MDICCFFYYNYYNKEKYSTVEEPYGSCITEFDKEIPGAWSEKP